MRLGFAIFRHFPYGGKSRNFVAIGRECARRGHEVIVIAMRSDAAPPEGVGLEVLPTRGPSNVARYRRFAAGLAAARDRLGLDLIVSAERVPGIDVHYAGDGCFAEQQRVDRPWWHRATPRARHFRDFERAVFDPAASARILVLTPAQQRTFQARYGTPDDRFAIVPPAVDRGRLVPAAEVPAARAAVLAEHGLPPEAAVMLAIGSDFRRKGVDRAIRSLARAGGGRPPHEPGVGADRPLHLLVIGRDREAPMRRLARRLGVAERVRFLQGREDVGRHLAAADLLVHPARLENTGTAIVEAIAAGVPVITTDVCGYACHVATSGAGRVLPAPYAQAAMDRAVVELLEPVARAAAAAAAREHAAGTDLYGRAARAADLIEAWAPELLGRRGPAAAAAAGDRDDTGSPRPDRDPSRREGSDGERRRARCGPAVLARRPARDAAER